MIICLTPYLFDYITHTQSMFICLLIIFTIDIVCTGAPNGGFVFLSVYVCVYVVPSILFYKLSIPPLHLVVLISHVNVTQTHTHTHFF